MLNTPPVKKTKFVCAVDNMRIYRHMQGAHVSYSVTITGNIIYKGSFVGLPYQVKEAAAKAIHAQA